MIKQPPKVVESKFLNILGLQALRYLLAKIIKKARRNFNNIDEFNNNNSREFNTNGMIFLSNTDQNIINGLEKEFSYIFDLLSSNKKKAALYSITKIEDKDTKVERLTITPKNLLKLLNTKFIYDLISKSNIWQLVGIDNGKNMNLSEEQILWFDKITMGKYCDVSNWHTDTFFDSYKYWYFPYGINKKNSVPMRFALGSHLFSFKRLFFEFKQSIFMNQYTDRSWRIDEDHSLLKSSILTKTFCKPHTTLVANTHAFHSRCPSSENAIRYQLHFTIRDNEPFSLSKN